MSRALTDIQAHGLATANPERFAINAAEDADEWDEEFQKARESVKYKHIVFRERWAKRNFMLHDSEGSHGRGRNPWPSVRSPRGTERPLWSRVFYALDTDELRHIRNGFAHVYSDIAESFRPEKELRAFQELEEAYSEIIPLLEALIDKLQAGLDDAEAWYGDFERATNRREYEKDLPETEVIWKTHLGEQKEPDDNQKEVSPAQPRPLPSDRPEEDEITPIPPTQEPIQEPPMTYVARDQKEQETTEEAPQPGSQDHGCMSRSLNWTLELILKPKFMRRLAVKGGQKLEELQGHSSAEEWIELGQHRAPPKWGPVSESDRWAPEEAAVDAEAQNEADTDAAVETDSQSSGDASNQNDTNSPMEVKRTSSLTET